ncbi:pectinesterase [Chitinophaga skermanii]|uniref:Pectinesterase n=1 Tax=Chitinophaga skermanii TaxID=331697 RepID=A0A327QSF0_9BACT|nr:pectinesterase family protein [Chitinophaga skermanii]RAJ06564.1 pectinesterase [Chitinophaga skermanii]
MKILIALICCLLPFAGMSQTTYPATITVAQDGSGDYTSIQSAINSMRAYSPTPVQVFIKNGVYTEKIIVHAWVTNVTFIGENSDSTIISFSDHTGKQYGQDSAVMHTFLTATCWVQGNDIRMENLCIENTAGRVGQAVALQVDGDRFVMHNCRLLGNQDTLLTANDRSRQYFKNCYITGTTDFIFGPATVVFQSCTIHSKNDSYITAASGLANQRFGMVFFDCRFTADEQVKKVYLGRPWRAYAKVAIIRCHLGAHIRQEGWHNWNNVGNERTAYYAEYGNTGPGAAVDKRVRWSKQLNKRALRNYTLTRIFENWIP